MQTFGTLALIPTHVRNRDEKHVIFDCWPFINDLNVTVVDSSLISEEK